MSRIPSFKDLEVWQKAMRLVRRVYGLTKSYPADEKYDLTPETRKTARSVPYNIAEGKMPWLQKPSATSRRHRLTLEMSKNRLGTVWLLPIA